MVHISREEVLKLARLSNIEIHSDEVDTVRMRLQQVLEYAACVSQVVDQTSQCSTTSVNTVRDDVILSTNPEPLLAQAPEQEDHLFVVPSILKNS